MTQYLYPQNLKAKAHLWFWGLRDFVILCVLTLITAAIAINIGVLLPIALALCYGILTIRSNDLTIMDEIKFVVRFCLTTQQYYEWR